MGLRDEAIANRRTTGPQSVIHRLLDRLDDSERDEVIELIWDCPDIGHRAVAETLDKHYGATVGAITEQMVRNHRFKPKP